MVFQIYSDLDTNGILDIKSGKNIIIPRGNLCIGHTSPQNSLDILTDNRLGDTFTGNVYGEGVRVSQNAYVSGNYVSLLEGSYLGGSAKPNVRIAAKYNNIGASLHMGTSNNSTAGITNNGITIDTTGEVAIGPSGTAGWKTFVPTINKVSHYGAGAIARGIYQVVNKVCTIMFNIQFGTSPTFLSGNWKMNSPVSSRALTEFGGAMDCGTVRVWENSTSKQYYLAAEVDDDVSEVITFRTGVQGAIGGNLNSTNVITFTDNDRIHGTLHFIVA
jgi:hypothetical protein